MIDCHAHISSSAFDLDRDDVIQRAQKTGITTIIAVSENIEDSHEVLKLCRDYPGFLRPCIGIHPDNLDIVVRRISQIKKESEYQVRQITTHHAQNLFGLG